MSNEKKVTLKEINSETVRKVIKLSDTLSEEHKKCVAPNVVSIAQARYDQYAWERAIYADEEIVGFIMFWINPDAKPEENGELCTAYLWRFMIGGEYQGKGYGKKALEIMFDKLKSEGHEHLYVSYVPCEKGPKDFYKNLGFIDTGEMDGDEVVAKKKL